MKSLIAAAALLMVASMPARADYPEFAADVTACYKAALKAAQACPGTEWNLCFDQVIVDRNWCLSQAHPSFASPIAAIKAPVGTVEKTIVLPSGADVYLGYLAIGVRANVLLNGVSLGQDITGAGVLLAHLVPGPNTFQITGIEDGPDPFGNSAGFYLDVLK